MPPKKNPTLYSVSKTFIWFALVSILLAASLAGIVFTDYNREWKEYQKQFVSLKLQKGKEELLGVEKKIDKATLADLNTALKAAESEFNSQKSSREKLLKEMSSISTLTVKARDAYQTLKQFEDSYRYYFEEYRLHKNPEADIYQKKMHALAPKLKKAKFSLDDLEKKKESLDLQLSVLEAKKKDAKAALDAYLSEKNLLQKRIETIKPTLVKDILNAPMIDFVAPTLRIQQIVLDGLQDDYHFAKVQKVDRCTTCHLGIDQKGFEDAPQPFRTHPKLDLYLGAVSKHPIEKMGCTVCHGGNGHSVSFLDTAHTPRDDKQALEWKKKYAWHELEKWEHKMLPLQHTQAACVKCHVGAAQIPQADKWNEGKLLAESMGCFNCHKVKGYENHWKVGPNLQRIDSKLDPEWVRKWLDNPLHFRPSTKMPRVFHLSNTDSVEDIEKNKASIVSIAAYLEKNSEPYIPASSDDSVGDKENGLALVKSVGCLGCHSLPGIAGSAFGPELSGLGSKVRPEWLKDWLKDPKHFSPDTRMPNLRLSDSQISDIAAYLLSNRVETFEQKADVKSDPKVVDEMVLTNLQGSMHRLDAETELTKMSADEKLLYLGKKSIAHQGCYTCHSIKGFENIKPIGAELSNEGRKDIHQFDFGFVSMERTRQAFISQKLKDPRVFDGGKEKSYYDKLRMPQFNLTDEQIGELTTFILSLTEEVIPLEMRRSLSIQEIETERGRELVSKLNCTGCHTLDGLEGTIRSITEDVGQMPPILDGEGAKVQEAWLNAFLKSPTTIRPWLNYRMPTFGFNDQDLTTLNKYFNHLSGEEISYGGLALPLTTDEKMRAGKELYVTFQCAKCHQVNAESSAMGSSFLAPDLTMARSRLKPAWVHSWLLDPQKIQEGTMMPTYFTDGQSPMPDLLGGDANAQIEAIRDYLYRHTVEEAVVAPSESESK